MRTAGGAGRDAAGRRTARLTWIGANAALVEQCTRITRELVGHGSGLPDQHYRLANVPVLPDTVEIIIDGQAWGWSTT
ncbi:hypothetical protein ACFQZK_00520 [Rhodococcus aetherivorans]